MKQNHDYLDANEDSTSALKGQVLLLQLKGAGYAAAFCLALLVFILVLAWVGRMLPEDSRFTEDPTPFSYDMTLEMPTLV
ncbi:MAG: RC-LH1 core complex protein PufX [Yoonia sp.]|nr:RC-LH1 core complex protein PufX [Yoonia sp.]MDG1867543.1 RC-LH1 core complex protein PufX [Yoonia sp.]